MAPRAGAGGANHGVRPCNLIVIPAQAGTQKR